MKKDEYMATQVAIFEIGKLASKLNIEDFLRELRHAEATAPMIDPTLYQRAADNMRAVKEMAEALGPIKIAFAKARATALQTRNKEAARDGQNDDS